MEDTQLTKNERSQIFAFNQLGDALCAPPPPLTDREKFLVLQALESIKALATGRKDALMERYHQLEKHMTAQPLTRFAIEQAEVGAAAAQCLKTIDDVETLGRCYR